DSNIDQATTGGDITDEEHEVVLQEEQVVTEKRAVPKERVRLSKDTITEEQQFSEQVRKEQIEEPEVNS
ncbi:MAG: YsnF/AvaK domain-containing protein, partial [Actinobacteria bacterium]|nr:YsnF/AvaK domain-containing protein [Actinomycetota bacterium]